MIRRDDGDAWLLISQIRHAQLAAELAFAWGNEHVPPLPAPELLIPAIAHHDDGWDEWERAPEIDPDTSRPRDFTEMPAATAVRIWTRSIEECGRRSPLGGIWVSRHFTWLASRARHNRPPDSAEAAALDRFMEEQTGRVAEWKAIAEQSTADLDSLIELGFRWVQFFDRVSLWLCCAERTAEEEFAVPAGGPLRIVPRCTDRMILEPYPFRTVSQQLCVVARPIRRRHYVSDDDLRHELNRTLVERLDWTLAR